MCETFRCGFIALGVEVEKEEVAGCSYFLSDQTFLLKRCLKVDRSITNIVVHNSFEVYLFDSTGLAIIYWIVSKTLQENGTAKRGF